MKVESALLEAEARPLAKTPVATSAATVREPRGKGVFADARDRFFDYRLGLFVHWGLYAINGWQEQDIWRRQQDFEDYAGLATRFNPSDFDPGQWIDAMRDAGMTYLVLTAKHIDGFCMWDTRYSDFKVTNTPFRRDVVAEVAKACRERDVAFCIYYSVVDHAHPAYPHAGRRWELDQPRPSAVPDLRTYLDYVKAQVAELCSCYGPLHAFWWDANIAKWHQPEVNALIRELQPGILINNRGFDPGDFGTPERDWSQMVDDELVFDLPVEACQSLGSQSWGYRDGEDYYTDKHVLRSIAKVLAKGGNYLLNTGPDAEGRIAAEDLRMLGVFGDWMRRCGEAFDGTEPASHLTSNRDVVVTQRGGTLYVIGHKEPVTRAIVLDPMNQLPRRATLLNTNEPVDCRVELLPWHHDSGKPCLRLHHLPLDVLDSEVPVIRLDF